MIPGEFGSQNCTLPSVIARMEFRCLLIPISVLFALALAGESRLQPSIPDADYWHAIWPNTPIPTPLQELLKSPPAGDEINDIPMKIDDTRYPKTLFYREDLHPGKAMKLEFSKRPLVQVRIWVTETKDLDKEGFTFAELCIKNKEGKGEHRFCAKTLRSVMDFAISKLGKNIQSLSTSSLDNQEQYTVEGVENLGDKAVMCHRVNFETVVYYCHEIHETTAFMVPLVGGDGKKTQALAVCHLDTAGMNHQMLDQLMGVDPGTNPVCHFLGTRTILWVPSLAVDTTYQSNIYV